MRRFLLGAVAISCLSWFAGAASAQVLYSFEDNTTQDWTPTTLGPDDFNDPESSVDVTSGIGNTDGQKSLKISGKTPGYVRNTEVNLDQDRIDQMNEAVLNEWNLEFDWTIKADENPGATRYWIQFAVAHTGGWTQLDMFGANGYPEWDPAGPNVQTMTATIPLNIFGIDSPGTNGPALDGASASYRFLIAVAGDNETNPSRTYYLDNFRLVDPNAVQVTPGDYNNDKALTASDIDALSAAVRGGATDKKYDLNNDNKVDDADRTAWVKTLKKTWVGDANLNGQFDTTDFVEVFSVGEYEDATAGNSGWADGDWNGDSDFDSGDFVAAFSDGGFEKGPVAAVSAVPEPSSLVLFGLAGLGLLRRRR